MDQKSIKRSGIMAVVIVVLGFTVMHQSKSQTTSQEVAPIQTQQDSSAQLLAFETNLETADSFLLELEKEHDSLEIERDPFSEVPIEEDKDRPLVLNGIFSDKDGYAAMINGDIMVVGASRNGFVITAIEKNRVELTNGEQTMVLSLEE